MHHIQDAEHGKGSSEHCGNYGEVFGHIVSDRKRRQGTASDEKLFTDLHDFDEFRRIGIEIDHVAGFFRSLRACVHGHTDIGLS